MKTQNEMPTKAQIDVSEKADTDIDVKIQDVGGSSIPSEVAKASDNLKTDALSNAQTHYDKKYNRLNARAKKELKAYERTAMQVISAVPLKYRERALLNYYEHTAKHMKGTQLMLPEPLKEAGTQIGANPESTQNALQQHQSHDRGRNDEQEMDR